MGQREAKRRVVWQLRKPHAEPRHETSALSTGKKRSAEASLLDPVWGIGIRVDDPRANDPRLWRGRNLLSEALSAVQEAIRDSETGLAHPASSGRCRTPTGNAGMHEISSEPQSYSLTAAGRLPWSSLGGFDLFLGRTGRPKPGRFVDSFWGWSWPCAVRTRPLPRRGYCDTTRRFVHYQICIT